MRSQQRHRGSHPQARPARCIVYIFKIACKVSGRELELPLEDPSPSADLILRQPQQRTEFERTKTREGGRRAKPPHKGREPLGSHASRPPPVQRPLPALELKLDFFFFPNSTLCRTELGARTPSRLSHFKRNLAPEGEGASDLKPCAPPPGLRPTQHPPALRPSGPPAPGTHRYTTGMGASINWWLASPGERTQAAGEAGGVGAPACESAGEARAVRGSRAFLEKSNSLRNRGIREAGFRATKRKDENEPRIKAPLRKCRNRVGAGRDVGRRRTEWRYRPAEALGPQKEKALSGDSAHVPERKTSSQRL